MRGGEYKCKVSIYLYRQIAVQKPHGNHKTKIYNRYSHRKRKRNPNIIVKIVIKSQKKRTKEVRGKNTYKSELKTIDKMTIRTSYCCYCLVAQLCLTLCDPMDCSPPGSSVYGIFQPRILECPFAISVSRGSS